MNRALKIVLLVVAVFAALYIGSMPLRNKLVKEGLREYLSAASGLPVSIASLKLGLRISPLRIRDLRIESAEPEGDTLLHLARLDVDFKLTSLLSDRPHIRELVVELGSLQVRKEADGSTNFDWVEGLLESQGRSMRFTSPSSTEQVEPAAVGPAGPSPRLRPFPGVVDPAPPANTLAVASSISNAVPQSVERGLAESDLRIDRFQLRIGKISMRDYSMHPDVPMTVDLYLDFHKVYEGITNSEAFYQQFSEDLIYRQLGGSMDDLKKLRD